MNLTKKKKKKLLIVYSRKNVGINLNFAVLKYRIYSLDLVREKSVKLFASEYACIYLRLKSFQLFLKRVRKIEFAKQPFPRHLINYNRMQICILSVSLDSRLNDT